MRPLALFAALLIAAPLSCRAPGGSAATLVSRPTAAPPPVQKGDVAPDFEGRLLSGATFRLADHVGQRMIVLNFFTTWCGPCREELPALQLFHATHREQAYVLGIDVDEKPETARLFLKDLAPSLPATVDSGNLRDRLEVRGFPTTVVVGRDGRIHLHKLGVIGVAQLEAALAADRGREPLSRASFVDRQPAGHPPLRLTPPEVKAAAGYEAGTAPPTRIRDIRPASETKTQLLLDVDYEYSGSHGDKRVFIDCRALLADGASPFGMRPAPVKVGRHTARAYIGSYSQTPEGATSTRVECVIQSRLDSAELASHTVAHRKKWSRGD